MIRPTLVQVTRVRITVFTLISSLANCSILPPSPRRSSCKISDEDGLIMAPSLQGLIDFLLNEVALCGSQGAFSSSPQTHFIQQEVYPHASLPFGASNLVCRVEAIALECHELNMTLTSSRCNSTGGSQIH